VPIIAEKIHMVRKKLGMTQRDYARLIGYRNANKYAKFERGETGRVWWDEKQELIKSVSESTGANPYWLKNDTEDALYNVNEDETALTVKEANYSQAYPMFATKKVINEWQREEEELKRRAQRRSGL